MKNNKGFTLIELLAVIVILAIIALIATPMIMGVIDSAKDSSAESSAKYYVEAVEKSMMTTMMTNTNILDGVYTVSSKGTTLTCTSGACKPASGTAPSFTVSFKGDAPADNDTVKIASGKVIKAQLKFAKINNKTIYVSTDGTTSYTKPTGWDSL